MRKKDYQEPTMIVVKLQHQSHILAASSEPQGRGRVQDYDVNSYYEE